MFLLDEKKHLFYCSCFPWTVRNHRKNNSRTTSTFFLIQAKYGKTSKNSSFKTTYPTSAKIM